MGGPRQNAASFTNFTFSDETTDGEITAVKVWQHAAGDSAPTPGTPGSLTLARNGNVWTWPPSPPPPFRNDINGIYFMFQGPNGWSPMLTVGWAEQLPNRISGASVAVSGGAGQYSIEEVVNTPVSVAS